MAALQGRRVVFVLAGEVLGGAERGALDIAEELGDHGARVAVVALDVRPGRARVVAEERGVPWTTARVSWSGSRIARGTSLLRVARTLRGMRPDAIIGGTNLPNVLCGLTWRLTGARVAVWRQCDVNGTTRLSPEIFRYALRSTPLVATAAAHARAWLVSEHRLDPNRVTLVSNPGRPLTPEATRAAWRERLGLSDRGVVGCMLAHHHAGKDHATLLRAWRSVVDAADAEPPVLLLAGRDAGAMPDSKALAFDLDLRDRVRFLGDVEDVAGLLGACDLAVFCSHCELLPRGVTEPMAAGLPVVATDLPATREVFGRLSPEELVPPEDPDALAAALLRLIGDRESWTRRGRANQAAVALAGAAGRRTWVELVETALRTTQ